MNYHSSNSRPPPHGYHPQMPRNPQSSHQRGPHPHQSAHSSTSSLAASSHHRMNRIPMQQQKIADNKEKKRIRDASKTIITLAGISTKSDTAELIHRSVSQHVFYENMLKQSKKKEDEDIMSYIQQLTEIGHRESALSALSKLRENNPDLAPLLWGTPAVIAALIQEVISVYPYLSGNIEMNSNHSNRCCNALALLQCVASHPETRGLFLKAYIPLFLYPFLNTELNSRPFEYLRLTSLGVIGALVKHPHPITTNNASPIIPDSEVTEFLVKTEAIPLCLHIMEYGNELSQTVATFIIQKILLDDYGLNYVCKTSDRFFAISQVLTKMIQDPVKKPSKKLIKHVVRCYLRLCDDNRAYLALHSVLPKYLQSSSVEALIGDDESCLNWLKQLRAKHKESLISQQRTQMQKEQYLQQQRLKSKQQQQQQQQQQSMRYGQAQYQTQVHSPYHANPNSNSQRSRNAQNNVQYQQQQHRSANQNRPNYMHR